MKVQLLCLLLVCAVLVNAAPYEDWEGGQLPDETFMVAAKRRGGYHGYVPVATCIDEETGMQCFCYYNRQREVIAMKNCNKR